MRVEVLPEYSKDGGGAVVNAIAALAVVEITLSDGRTLSRRVEYYCGDTNRPPSADDVAGKFRDCAGMVLTSGRAEKVLDLMINLESLKDTNELVTLLTP